MPTYEYVCTDCRNEWEEIQKISEDPIQVCPKCQKSTAKRQISGGNFILKGGGWYADLYASSPKKGSDGKSEGSAASDSSSSGSSGTKGGETKSTSAPAAKAEGGSSSTTAPSASASASAPK